MSTIKASWSQLASTGQVICLSTTLHDDMMATSSQDGSCCQVQVWEKDSSTGDWDLISQISTDSQIQTLAWCHPENGQLLVGGSQTGAVYIWRPPRPGFSRNELTSTSGYGREEGMSLDDEKEWVQSGHVMCSKHPIRHVCFAPRQLGLVLCAACQGGSVHVIEADRVLGPRNWSVQSTFSMGPGLPGKKCGGVTWRSFSPGVAPLLAVGSKGIVEIWQYMQRVMKWQRVSTFSLSEPDAQSVSVHWAPTLGRPCDLIAAAHGKVVDIFSLTGDTSDLKTQLLRSLKHDAAVHKVEFNTFGTCLAAATKANVLHLWKPDFVGKWLLVSSIAGSPDALDEE
ncbi:hypothetical protein CEUSTIGMA_g2871.t1 [Chlamydomonas eustigma]|uniref:Anaphase-promoting complex subunit 4 WD40 domain-containing protein n=1 Tax=Chlamydomonas eustigma TaxID=1157962 RepID=A0A250WX69_9CHLO|nr:hypothetical protein CEUSTIGMA_g2871.t1 [Chlamydomonas eustigma]|eukprot:GAX75427.1 hypothetical protein CEUSTIGMA_g2871.t1 [Chlamydomonas eustigma]